MNTFQAIPTQYAGKSFRSRIEARWAVFFNTLGIRWEYEKEGYVLEDGACYLSDFWIPHLQCWIEIKGARPTPEEAIKARLLCKGSGFPVYMFFGDIPESMDSGGESAWAYWLSEGEVIEDTQYEWQCCDTCGKYGIEYWNENDRICDHTKKGVAGAFNTFKIGLAYTRARSFPFTWKAGSR